MAIVLSLVFLVLPQAYAQSGVPNALTRMLPGGSLEVVLPAINLGQTAPATLRISPSELASLPTSQIITSTAVTDGKLTFTGVLMRDLLDHIEHHPKTVTATALNDYEIDIPVSDFMQYDVLLAWMVDSDVLTVHDKGPFWIVYPRDHHIRLQDIRYDYRWVWQLYRLTLH